MVRLAAFTLELAMLKFEIKQPSLVDVLFTINRNLRRFAESGKKHFLWQRTDVLHKPDGFLDLL